MVVLEDDGDKSDWLRKVGEAYGVPPWEIGSRLSVPQLYAIFHSEGSGVEECSTFEEAVARANAIRKKKGLPLHPATPQKG